MLYTAAYLIWDHQKNMPLDLVFLDEAKATYTADTIRASGDLPVYEVRPVKLVLEYGVTDTKLDGKALVERLLTAGGGQ